ncbi:hypothetical protein [Pseudoduganella namucuonensis]|uniref:Uncharacterized protein n=1 Tax=Pseudoduganella namucuonensis TaxID=1035707 RepID=A0A1I7GED0_9BURK|nr:hypothetical protein [Pseudoduganella namucuonensis]SFU46790.1 hypothetical protein SAMN05216552_1003267 [Pseudoduganella namucuonensis]
MSLIHSAIQRLKRDYFRWHYMRGAARILTTRPMEKGVEPFILLSMVQKRDVMSYLVAVKSFTHFLNPARIVVVCDPSIDEQDRAILMRHVPHLELRRADEFTHPDIPRGGTWERLFAITGYAQDDYVIQLDADTVTIQPIPEVREAVHRLAGFVLGEAVSTPLSSLGETRARALPWLGPNAHIQSMSETEMINVGLPENTRYVRGCSGFTGFPPTATLRENMLDFSRRMTSKLGKDWTRWGTEQVTSNYLAANARGTAALPFPKFGTPDKASDITAFYHFIGSMRFTNSKYATVTAHAIDQLRPT